jgi:hypothetical protein
MIKHVEYQEEKLPLKLSFSAMKRFNNIAKKNILKLDDELNLNDIEHLFFACYASGCQSEEIEQKYSQKDMEVILDEVYQDFVALIPVLMNVDKKK